MAKILLIKIKGLKSDLLQYSDAYIAVKRTITVEGDHDDKIRNKKLIFENNALFRLCISKINNTFIDNPKDFDIVMRMYNLLESSQDHSMKSGSLQNYYREKVNDNEKENDVNNKRINNDKTLTIKSFEHKTKIIGKTPNDNNILDREAVVPLKFLSNVQRFLDFSFINCKTGFDLSWSKECISEISITLRIPSNIIHLFKKQQQYK